MTLLELNALLAKYNIPTQGWGNNGTKTIRHLLQEINTLETELFVEDKKLIRLIHVAVIHMYYNDGIVIRKLKEQKQRFANGSVRIRNYPGSISEKIKISEDPVDAVFRSLHEEIGIKNPEHNFTLQNPRTKKEGLVYSNSYPRLLTLRRLFIWDMEMPTNFYCKDGYVETQEDKTSHFVWKNVAPTSPFGKGDIVKPIRVPIHSPEYLVSWGLGKISQMSPLTVSTTFFYYGTLWVVFEEIAGSYNLKQFQLVKTVAKRPVMPFLTAFVDK